MREIKLVNNEGEEFDLTRPDACLQDISGIGMEIEFETVRIGQCDVVVDEQPQYNPVSGMIPFMDMEPYTEFLQFIAKRPITLAYKPKNAWYFTSVRVSVVEKEEITPVDEYAETDVDFYRLGPWYSTLRIDPYSDTTAAKRYTYTYPYRYVDSTAPGILLQNPSGQESPCTIEIYGPARNPRWELVKNGPEPQSVFLGDTPQGGTVDAPVELTGISSTVINKNLVTLPVPRPLRRVGAAQDKCSARVTSVYDKRIVLDGSEMWAEYTDENWQGAGYHVYRFYNADALISQYIASNKYPSRRGASNFKGTLGVTSGAQSILFSVVEQKTVDDWKAYLAAQKAAGTPLIIYRQSTAYDGTNGLDVCLMKYQTGFVELDGTEASHIFDGMFYLDYSAAWPTPANRVNGVCSHYPYGTYGKGKIGLTDNGAAVAYNPNSDYTGDEGGLANWKAYLAAQKEAGTPVQVAYQLAAPEVYATDPVDIQKAAGLSISSGAVTTEIKEGQKLVVRSEADRLEIAIYTTENEWVEDVYQQSDFSTARFIYAPAGDSTLKFSHEGSQELNVSVEVRAYYEAV
ncbi:phage distal tail protein domain-containing protein [Ruthenibacterium lactatiformans]|uniref:phage distal tail protein domain-containing protein n=1 Tax=Ruthenibacterium lactatiformans TaxID=1550024 RepID=UPI002671BAA3|nr:hypothetical protein [Ruthenibacterium lactatiformans]